MLLISSFQGINVGNSANLFGFPCSMVKCTLVSRFSRDLLLRLQIHFISTLHVLFKTKKLFIFCFSNREIPPNVIT